MGKNTVYLGLDVHKDTTTLAGYLDRDSEPFVQKTITSEKAALKKELKKLSSLGKIVSCYEAGFSGFYLQRFSAIVPASTSHGSSPQNSFGANAYSVAHC